MLLYKPFPGDNKFTGDISKWDVSRVTDMNRMFHYESLFNGDISKWDVSSVSNMPRMFASASSFNGDISKWNVSRVTDMQGMFIYASKFDQILCGAWKTSPVAVNRDGMFVGSTGKTC